MAKRVRWTGTIRNQVDVMSKADLLRIRPLESRVLGNLARTVRGEADGKGLEAGWPSLPMQTDA
jgi:hypothetical protein